MSTGMSCLGNVSYKYLKPIKYFHSCAISLICHMTEYAPAKIGEYLFANDISHFSKLCLLQKKLKDTIIVFILPEPSIFLCEMEAIV